MGISAQINPTGLNKDERYCNIKIQSTMHIDIYESRTMRDENKRLRRESIILPYKETDKIKKILYGYIKSNVEWIKEPVDVLEDIPMVDAPE